MMLRDPVCGQRIHRNRDYIKVEYEHVMYHLCCPFCQAEFEAEPERYARPEWGEPTEEFLSNSMAANSNGARAAHA